MSCVINWTCTFIVGKFFPKVESIIGPYVFIFFGIVSTIAFLYTLKFLPETKGKTFAEIEAEFDVLNGINRDEEKVALNDPQDNRGDTNI